MMKFCQFGEISRCIPSLLFFKRKIPKSYELLVYSVAVTYLIPDEFKLSDMMSTITLFLAVGRF